MSILFFIFDLFFLSFIPLVGFLVASLKIDTTTKEDESVEILTAPKEELPSFSWALSTQEKAQIETSDKKSAEASVARNSDTLMILIAGSLIMISPLAFALLKINPLSYLISIIAMLGIYIKKSETNFLDIGNIFKRFQAPLQSINSQRLHKTVKEFVNFLKAQPRLKIIYSILAVDVVYLDMFVAKISLDKLSAAAYIFTSVLSKAIIVLSAYGLHRWLIERNIFKTKVLDTRVLGIFAFMSLTLLYMFVIFSKPIVKIMSFGMLSNFHTALPYVFAVHLLLGIIFILFYHNHTLLTNKKGLQNFILHFTISLHGAILVMLMFFYISSLEAVTFFVGGIALFLLTLFYHLFYRLDTYTQLV